VALSNRNLLPAHLTRDDWFTQMSEPADLDYWRLFHGVDGRVPVNGLTFGIRVLHRFLRSC